MKLTDRVSYLQGLMDGLEINDSTKEGKVLIQMADILQEMALSIEDVEGEIDEVVELVDTLDEDLGELEDVITSYSIHYTKLYENCQGKNRSRVKGHQSHQPCKWQGNSDFYIRLCSYDIRNRCDYGCACS